MIGQISAPNQLRTGSEPAGVMELHMALSGVAKLAAQIKGDTSLLKLLYGRPME